ncbi:hypothetical protein [Algoriphagus boritolerans]|nr:hypothetical protein [Algoriphagus boritolerans]
MFKFIESGYFKTIEALLLDFSATFYPQIHSGRPLGQVLTTGYGGGVYFG